MLNIDPNMDLQVRSPNLSLTEPIQSLVQRRLGFALGRYASQIRRVEVRLADINGSRGGVDKSCRVEVTLQRGDRVRAESTELRVRDAIDRAAGRAGRRVSRKLGRSAAARHASA